MVAAFNPFSEAFSSGFGVAVSSNAFSGYVGLGTGVSTGNAFHEVSGGSYGRQATQLSGSLGLYTQDLGEVGAASLPPEGMIRVAGFFDTAYGDHLLAWWELDQPVRVGTVFPDTSITVDVRPSTRLTTTTIFLDAGMQIGTVNGKPLIAATRMLVTPDSITPMNSLSVLDNPLFSVGGVNVGRFDANGNLLIRGAIYAGDTTIARSS